MNQNTKLTFSPAYRVYRLFVAVICPFFGLGCCVVCTNIFRCCCKRWRSIDIRLLRLEKITKGNVCAIIASLFFSFLLVSTTAMWLHCWLLSVFRSTLFNVFLNIYHGKLCNILYFEIIHLLMFALLLYYLYSITFKMYISLKSNVLSVL